MGPHGQRRKRAAFLESSHAEVNNDFETRRKIQPNGVEEKVANT